jgi:hypothetical protein
MPPITPPDDDSMFTLWLRGAVFVMTIETIPALAVNEVVLYFSWPSGLVSRLRCVAPAAEALVEGEVEGEVVGAVAGLLLEEPPHPASAALASRATSPTV